MKYNTLEKWIRDMKSMPERRYSDDERAIRIEELSEYLSGEQVMEIIRTEELYETKGHFLKRPPYSQCLEKIEEMSKKVSIEFTKKLIKIFEMNGIDRFTRNDKHFFLLYITLAFHIDLEVQYNNNVPYIDEKYFNKLATADKEKQVSGKGEVILAPVQDYLRLFKSRCDELLQSYQFNHAKNRKTIKERDKNLLIDELIDLIVMGNYKNDKKYKGNVRVTHKAKELVKIEDEILNLTMRTGKKYIKVKK